MAYDTDNLEELVQQTKEEMRGFLFNTDRSYQRRVYHREMLRLPVVSFVGYGRSGKDTAAEIMATVMGDEYSKKMHTALKSSVKYLVHYGGSTSSAVAPLIAKAVGKTEEEVFAERHQHRMFWFEFCNILRRDDPTLIARILLGQADILVGLRDIAEIEATRAKDVVAAHIWVSRPGVDSDETVAFSRDDCDLVLENNGSLEDLKRKIQGLSKLLLH